MLFAMGQMVGRRGERTEWSRRARRGVLIAFATATVCVCIVPGHTHAWGATGDTIVSCRWVAAPFPVLPGATLYDVSGTSSTDVWVVGAYNYAPSAPVVGHWDGVTWSVVEQAATDASLFGVVAIAPDDAWAVGRPNGNLGMTIVEHWDGTAWRLVPSPAPGSLPTLISVAAASSDDVWAVGTYSDTRLHGLIEHWDGIRWRLVPDAPVGAGEAFNDVSAVSGSDAWAVGYLITESLAYQPLIEHWDGAEWSVQSIPPPHGGTSDILHGVSASSPSDAWAVGAYGEPFPGRPLAYHWNGNAWRQSTIHTPSGISSMYDVANDADGSAPGAGAWAVGNWFQMDGTGHQLTERFDGRGWALVPSPAKGSPRAVASVASTDAWAVGSMFDEGLNDTVPFTERTRGCGSTSSR